MAEQISRELLLDTIALYQLAWPGGIAIIRVSGPAVSWLGDLLFEPISSRFSTFSQMREYSCAPGYGSVR